MVSASSLLRLVRYVTNDTVRAEYQVRTAMGKEGELRSSPTTKGLENSQGKETLWEVSHSHAPAKMELVLE